MRLGSVSLLGKRVNHAGLETLECVRLALDALLSVNLHMSVLKKTVAQWEVGVSSQKTASRIFGAQPTDLQEDALYLSLLPMHLARLMIMTVLAPKRCARAQAALLTLYALSLIVFLLVGAKSSRMYTRVE